MWNTREQRYRDILFVYDLLLAMLTSSAQATLERERAILAYMREHPELSYGEAFYKATNHGR